MLPGARGCSTAARWVSVDGRCAVCRMGGGRRWQALPRRRGAVHFSALHRHRHPRPRSRRPSLAHPHPPCCTSAPGPADRAPGRRTGRRLAMWGLSVSLLAVYLGFYGIIVFLSLSISSSPCPSLPFPIHSYLSLCIPTIPYPSLFLPFPLPLPIQSYLLLLPIHPYLSEIPVSSETL